LQRKLKIPRHQVRSSLESFLSFRQQAVGKLGRLFISRLCLQLHRIELLSG